MKYLIYLSIFFTSTIIYSSELFLTINSFPPNNKLPTRSNALELNLINNLNKENKISNIEPITSQFRNLNYSREDFDFDNAVHLLMRSTIGPTLEEINLAVDGIICINPIAPL